MKNLIFLALLGSTLTHAQVRFYENALYSMVYQVSGSWLGLGRYIQGCLLSADKCGLNAEEFKILQDIGRIHAQVVEKNLPRVTKPADYPHIFNQTGAPRIAVTGNEPFSPIYLNQDLLVNPQTGEIISRARAISFLVHEVGHHTGLNDTQERVLDRIGDAVAKYFTRYSEHIDLAQLKHPLLGAYVFNSFDFETLKKMTSKALRFPEIKIHVGDYVKVFNNVIVNDIITHFPGCPNADAIQLVYASNLRWFEISRVMEDGRQTSLMANLRILCGKTLATAKEYKGYFFYRGVLRPKNGQFIFDHDLSSAAVTESDAFENPLEATVTQSQFNTNTLQGGGNWNGQITVELNKKIDVKVCKVNLTADDFPQSMSGERYSVMVKSCVLKAKTLNTYELTLQDTFLKTTRPSTYYIKDVMLFPRTGTPIFARMPVRQNIQIVNPTFKPLKVVRTRLFDKTETDRSTTGISGLAPNDIFFVEITFEGQLKSFVDFFLTLRGVRRDGQTVSGQHMFLDEFGRPSLEVQLRQEGPYAVLTFKDTLEGSQVIKEANLHRFEMITDNLEVVKTSFPQTFQIRTAK